MILKLLPQQVVEIIQLLLEKARGPIEVTLDANQAFLERAINIYAPPISIRTLHAVKLVVEERGGSESLVIVGELTFFAVMNPAVPLVAKHLLLVEHQLQVIRDSARKPSLFLGSAMCIS